MKTNIYLRSFITTLMLVFAFVIIDNYGYAQNTFPATGSAGIGTTSPNASSLLDMVSTTKGLLIPRMTTAQRNAIVSPATGLLIYQTNGGSPGFYYYDGSDWTVVSKKGWNLTGNSGTDPLTNFVGTKDAQPLIFKVNNQRAGYIEHVGNNNTSFGYQGLLANTSGFFNTAIGYNTLKSNIAGNRNTAIGAYSLIVNTADNNTAIGTYALVANTIGTGNVATGVNVLQANTIGNNNTGYGINALFANTTGNENTALGSASLNGNATGNDNTATGFAALNWNNGDNNTATGAYSLYLNSAGSSNTANGYQALYNNTTGYSNVAIGTKTLFKSTNAHNIVAIGDSALFNQLNIFEGGEFPIFGDNTAIGSKALYGNSRGQRNTAVGSNALYNTQGTSGQGSYNSGMGYEALLNNVWGSANTSIGAYADVNDASYSFSTAIGCNAMITASNQIRIGSIGDFNDPNSIGGKVGWSTLSDGRVKKNIKDNVPGLAFINKLKPVTYNLNLEEADKIVQPPARKDKDGRPINSVTEDATARKAKETVLYTGFVAQDVEKAAKSLNYDFSGVDAAKNDKDLYGLRYAEFVVPLVKAVQELSKMNDDREEVISMQQKEIADLKERMSAIETMLKTSQANNLTDNKITSLSQNIPNPFSNTTTIEYTLPQKFTTAQIVISDQQGRKLQSINVSGSGKNNINVKSLSLAAGTYNYTLVVNGKSVSTKQMVIIK